MGNLGKYEVDFEHRIGRGAMGVVYKAWDPELNRWVAIKTFDADDGPEEAESWDSLSSQIVAEARACASLQHPNIVQIHDVIDGTNQHGRWAYLVMEFVQGKTLRQWLRDNTGANRLRGLLGILAQIASGLDHAHKQGVVHRDVKPSNVMVTHEGIAKIMDFGVAKRTTDRSLSTTGGSIVGTPDYMSPEQIKSERVTGRSDQYGLATVAYQAITGSLPFEGSLVELAHAKTSTDAPPPSKILPGLAKPYDDVFNKALARNPEQRYESCSAFAAALSDAVNQVSRPAPPRPPLWWAAATLTAVAVAVIAVKFSGRSSDAESELRRAVERQAKLEQALLEQQNKIDELSKGNRPPSGAPESPKAKPADEAVKRAEERAEQTRAELEKAKLRIKELAAERKPATAPDAAPPASGSG